MEDVSVPHPIELIRSVLVESSDITAGQLLSQLLGIYLLIVY
jgi:hypothetical protein